MNKNWILGGVMLLATVIAGAWWLGWLEREDATIAELREMAAAPQDKDNDRAMRDLVGDRVKGLSDEQRMKMFEQMAPIFIPLMAARFEQEYDKFMALSEAERNRELDRRIDEMKRRGGPGRGEGARPSGGNRPQIDAAKMDAFRKKMLDWVTPAQRGKFQNGIQMFNQRLKQRGMEEIRPPGGGFF